ncbi:MAG: hypothetical protein Q8K98_03440 [Bacteroidota bacterium]|nr:hypothetical protein [Bacteroidota bacterium]
MKISNLIISALIIFSFIGCEKEEDPLVRVSNNLAIYTEVELKKTDGYTKLFEEVDAGRTTDYAKIPDGFYIITSTDVAVAGSFQASKNKKYTIEINISDKQIPYIRVTEP